MKNININQLLHYVEKYGFKSTDTHWCCGENSKNTRSILRKIIEYNTSGLQLKHKHSCPHSDCINPDCYELKYCRKSSAFMDEEDFLGVVESVDYDECLSMGMKKYLEKYNSDKIDLLKITMRQLREVISYLANNTI